MESKSKDSPLFSDISYRILKDAEPKLSEEEKHLMWVNIERRTLQKTTPLFHLRKWYGVAAIAAVLVIASVISYQTVFRELPYNSLSALVDIDTLKKTTTVF